MRSFIAWAHSTGFILFVFSLWIMGCQQSGSKNKKNEPTDTDISGTIHISADESFKPIIDAEVQVFEGINMDTHIIVHYKPEADCLKDFFVDSIRMIIATRGYDLAEENFMKDTVKVSPTKLTLARDAIAVIVNPLATDSFFTVNELKAILTGKSNKNLIPVFDGVKATSTVRYIVDSMLKNEPLSPNSVAARTSEGVIDYVAKTPGAIGFIGVSWIGNKEDTMQTNNFLKKVKVAYLESTDKVGGYVLPNQDNIYMGRYPMVRDLVYTLKENFKGLGTAFGDFLGGERGQLIFRRAYLVPLQRNFTLRKAELRK